MEHLVFDSEVDAEISQRVIFDIGKSLATAAGYTVLSRGIRGRIAGEDRATAGITSAWDVPRRRQDGKWVVLHPKYHKAATPERLEALMSALGNVVIESSTGEWFPEAPLIA